jgi:pimeloyl-ACP methyl ester carboxylesterase
MRELLLQANGLRVRCLADGPADGPLALLLHGFPEGAESWAAQLSALAGAGCFAVAPDLRGYGGTDCPEGVEAYAMPHLAADVAGIMDALGRGRGHLAGHDWGALVGWGAVSAHPDRFLSWSALSVGHPTAFLAAIREDTDQTARSAYVNLFLDGKAERVLLADGERRLRGMFPVGLGPGSNPIPEPAIDRFATAMARPGRLTAGLNYYRANIAPDHHEVAPMAAGPVRTPTQLIWGDHDPACGRTQAETTGAHVDGDYRLEVLEGAGHWLLYERSEEVSSLLLQWINGHLL